MCIDSVNTKHQGPGQKNDPEMERITTDYSLHVV